MSEKQSRNYLGVLYPDSEIYNCEHVLLRLQDTFEDYAYILHDSDVSSEGELKKPHYHWVGKRRTPAPLSTISNALHVPERDIEYCKSWKYAVRYLIHADNPEKYQYTPDLVVSSFPFVKYVESNVNTMKSKMIFDYIMSNPSAELEDVLRWVFENDLFGTFQRQWAMWNHLINKQHFVR